MRKVLALLLMILLALASVAAICSYRDDYCRGKANSRWSRQLEKGQPTLEEGKAKLEAASEGCQRARRSTSKLKTTCSWC